MAMADTSAALPTDAHVHDVIIIGAGPCGLAMAARLREKSPAALFTDEEHRRFSWLRKHGHKMALKYVRYKNGKTLPAEVPSVGVKEASSQFGPYDILILDAEHDEWMGRWKRLFNTYDITHLRSHMLWHLDPGDRDSLLAHTRREGRENECTEMKGCVGREMSKHAMKARRGKYIGSR